MALSRTSLVPGSMKRDLNILFTEARSGKFERQSAQGGESRPVKRARASKPKVKSGCITCK